MPELHARRIPTLIVSAYRRLHASIKKRSKDWMVRSLPGRHSFDYLCSVQLIEKLPKTISNSIPDEKMTEIPVGHTFSGRLLVHLVAEHPRS